MKLRFTLYGGGVLLALIGGAYVLRPTHHQAPQRSLTPVRVRPAWLDTSPLLLHAQGTIEAATSVLLRSQVAGLVTSVHFKPGERVEKGKVLVEIDHTILSANLSEKQAKLRASRAELDRYERLLRAGPSGVSRSTLEKARSQVEQDQAQAHQASQQLADSYIKAPFSGVLSSLLTSSTSPNTRPSPGSYVSPGTPLARIVPASGEYVRYAIDQEAMNAVKLGQLVRMTLPTSSTLLTGHVSYVAPNLDPIAHTLTLHARLDGKNTVKPGTFVFVSHVLKPKNQQIMIPERSIISLPYGVGVYIVRKGHVLWRDVELGARHGDRVAVLSGLEEGNKVVVRGMQRIYSSGQPVRVIPRKKRKRKKKKAAS